MEERAWPSKCRTFKVSGSSRHTRKKRNEVIRSDLKERNTCKALAKDRNACKSLRKPCNHGKQTLKLI